MSTRICKLSGFEAFLSFLSFYLVSKFVHVRRRLGDFKGNTVGCIDSVEYLDVNLRSQRHDKTDYVKGLTDFQLVL